MVLYIKNNIPYVERQNLVSDDLEMIYIEVNRKHSKPHLISTWYRPPGSDIDIFNDFELFLFKCDIEDKEIILLGDLNCNFIVRCVRTSVLESYRHCAPYIN